MIVRGRGEQIGSLDFAIQSNARYLEYQNGGDSLVNYLKL